MQARDVMTSPAITVGPEMSVGEIAALLLARQISAVPVVDDSGALVGIVSEGDLFRRPEIGTERRESHWLRFFAERASRASEFVQSHGMRARDVMTRDVVTVAPDTDLGTVAHLLEERRIKRVPVVEHVRVVGIVSRANLMRALAVRWRSEAGQVTPDDRAIWERLAKAARDADWLDTSRINLVVSDGVVHIWGVVDTDAQREALRVLAERIPGVRGVEDHLSPNWFVNTTG
jgi:CBS domain-containing protein